MPAIPIHSGSFESPGGSVKRSLAMAFCGLDLTIAKAYGLDDATQIGTAHHKGLTCNRYDSLS